jgi:hypothetical protein
MSSQFKCPNCKNYFIDNILHKRIRMIVGGLFGGCLSNDLIYLFTYNRLIVNFPEYPWYEYLKLNDKLDFSFNNLSFGNQVWFILHILLIILIFSFFLGKKYWYGKKFECKTCGFEFIT